MTDTLIHLSCALGAVDKYLADHESNASDAAQDIISDLLALPRANAVEVVRCRECKHLAIKDMATGYCQHNMTGIVQPWDYCSKGERREDA